MKRFLPFALMIGLVLASSVSYASERWWRQPAERTFSRSQKQFQRQARKQVTPLEALPNIDIATVEWITKSAKEYAYKKADCKDEITATMSKLLNSSGSFSMDSGGIDATLASDYNSKCADVHVCDENGEVVPFNPADPDFSQTPSPYSYGVWTCAKDVIHNIDGKNYLNYKVSAPLICNYSTDNGPIKIQSIFSSDEPTVEFCYPSGENSKAFNIGKYLSVTTVDDYLDKYIAYTEAKSQPDKAQEAKATKAALIKTSAPETKACIFSLPQKNTPPFVLGASTILSNSDFLGDMLIWKGSSNGKKYTIKIKELSTYQSACNAVFEFGEEN